MGATGKYPFRLYLVALILLATLPAVGIIWYTGVEQRQAVIAQARQEALNLAAGFAEIQKILTVSVQTLTGTLAEMPEVRTGNSAASTLLFQAIIRNHPEYANILVVSPTGDVITSAVPATRVNVADREHIREALSHKDFSAGEYILSRMVGEPVFPYARPVLAPDGQVALVLVAALRLSAYSHLMGELSLPAGCTVNVVDHAGRRMFRIPHNPDTSPIGESLRPEAIGFISGPADQGVYRLPGSDGVDKIFAYHRLRLSPDEPPYACIVLGIPEAAALAAADGKRHMSLMLLSLSAVLAVAAALMLGEWTVVRPLKRITGAAQTITWGDLKARSGLDSGPRELAELAGTFDAMAQAIERRDQCRSTVNRCLRASRRRFKDVAKAMSDWIWEVDAQGIFTMSTGSVAEIMGYMPKDTLGRHFSEFLIPGELERIMAMFEVLSATLAPLKDVEAWHQAKDGRRVCLRTNAIAMRDAQGRFAGYRGVCMDVTRRKAYEDQLLRSLGEKEVLLKEIHHRVKNNLQIISSMLSLESRDFHSAPEVEAAFEAMRGRVRSIALIHEMLYSAENLAAVNMAHYLASLCATLNATLAMPGQRLVFKKGGALHLPLDKAVPLALLANELASNALKHAYGEGGGEARMSLRVLDGQAELLVEDDGLGMGREVKEGERHGLGMQLVMALADQIGGSVLFPGKRVGTAVKVPFPLATLP